METRTNAKATRRRKASWTERIVLSVRIQRETNTRLTKAVADTDRGPQDIVEEALNRYFDHLKIPAANQLDQGEPS